MLVRKIRLFEEKLFDNQSTNLESKKIDLDNLIIIISLQRQLFLINFAFTIAILKIYKFIMKKIISLSLVLMFIISTIWAQNEQPVLSCGHAKYFKNQRSVKNVVQSPYLFDYDVKFYFIDIEVTSASTYITGEVTIKAETVVAEFDTVAFELNSSLTIDGVEVNGESVSFYEDGDEAFAIIPNPLPSGELFDFKVTYHGQPSSGGFFSGISQENTSYGPVTWTLSEPFNARDWWPTKQVLEDKADSCWVFLTTINSEMAGSEGLLTNVSDMGNGKHRFEWKSNYPIDYYLISFSVADYMEYNVYAHPEAMNGDSILIQNFIYNNTSYFNQNKSNIDATAEMIEVYSEKYSLYPFHNEKYGHCTSGIGGGMEHQTMTTLGGFSFGLVAHELGHMWFGDNVTCATWSDIWVNEGFATYSEYLARENILGQANANANMASLMSNVESNGTSGSTFIPADEIYYGNEWRIFNGTLSYYKGAIIIHMMRFEVNDDDLFFAALQEYQTQFAGSTATGADVRDIFTEKTGIDFTDFFEQWYYGQGYPTFDVEWNQDGDQFVFETTQTPSNSATPLFKTTVEYQLNFTDGTNTKIRVFQDLLVQNYEVEIPAGKTVESVEVDPDNWLLNKVGSVYVNENENSVVSVKVFPNPASDELHLYFKDLYQKKEITILDLSGKVIMTTSLENNIANIDISTLPRASYVLRIKEGERTSMKKFVKE